MADGCLNFDTKINTKGFNKGIGDVENSLKSVKNMLGNIAKAAVAAFSIKKIVGFGKQAVESAAEVKAATSQMEQGFSSLYDVADESIKRVADAAGIVQTRLNGVGTSIYAFAKASGMDSASAMKMMEDALVVTADSAAYYDRSLEDTAESLKSFLKGNYANDAALGISCTETTRNIAANKLYGKSFQELSEAQKQLTLLQMVKDANALSGAEGQAAREADGWENVIGNLKETWKQFQAVLGQPVLAVATVAVKNITAALAELTSAASVAVGTLNNLLGIETDNTSDVASNITASVAEQDALTDSVEETTKAQEKSLASFDKINKLSGDAGTKPENASTSPVSITPVVKEKTVEATANKLSDKIQRAIKPIQIAWEDHSDELISNAVRAVDTTKTLLKSIGKSVAEVWENGSGERFVGNIIVGFSDVLGIIGDINIALTDAWNDNGRGTALIQSYADKWNAILELIHSVSDTFRTAWNDGTGESICSNILDILTNINNIQGNIATQFKSAWDVHGVEIWSGILGIAETVLGVINRITDATAEWAGKLNFSPILNAVSGLLDALNELVGVVGGVVADVYEAVLLPLAKWTIEDLAPAAVDLLAGALSVLAAVISALKPMGEWLWDNFLAPIAKWTGGVIVKVIESLAKALKKVGDWIKKHQTAFQDFVIVVGSIGSAFAIASVIMKAVAAFQAIGGIVGVVSAALSGLTTVVTVLGGAISFLTSPLFLIPLAIGAVIAAGVLLVKHWDEVKAFAVDLWESIQDVLFTFFDKVVEIFDNIKDFLTGVWEGIKDVFSEVGQFFETVFKAAWVAIQLVWAVVVNFFKNIWDGITNAFKNASDWFKKLFTTAWNNIVNAFKAMGNWFSDRWEDVKNALKNVAVWFKDLFTAAWEAIVSIFTGIGTWFANRWNDIVNAFSAVGTWFGNMFTQAWNNIKAAFANVGSFFQSVWNGITSVFSHITDWFRDKFSEAWQAVKNVFSTGGAIFEGIAENIGGIFIDVVNSLIDGINWVIAQPFNLINDALDGLRDIEILDFTPFDWLPTLSVPEIPHLAKGTVVPANYGNFLAVLGDNKREPEIVSPISSIEKAVENVMQKHNGNSPKEIVIYTYLYPNSAAFHREVVKVTNNDKARKGG